ncbi:MAG: ABC transporter ATP-binding protein [Erythrobacter sp.]
MLAADNLALMRGHKMVLELVSIKLEPGQITTICGPNGAGKSSLLLGLAGLLNPAVGEVSLEGKKLSGLEPRKRAQHLGYLPQSGDVAWDVAVEALVALGRLPHGDLGWDAIEAAISALSLDELRHRRVSNLSGGERARVLLARVLAGEPQWILADEPLAALDLAHQLALASHFKACARKGQGVVLVLHDLALAMNHSDRVLVLKDGRLIADGAPQDALSQKMIATAWGVKGQWIGEEGARALVVS